MQPIDAWLANGVFWAAIVSAPLVGGLTPVRLRWVLLAGAGLAAAVGAGIWDVATSDDSEFYDIGREGALVFGLLFVSVGLVLIAAGAGVGRLVRRHVCARRREAVAE